MNQIHRGWVYARIYFIILGVTIIRETKSVLQQGATPKEARDAGKELIMKFDRQELKGFLNNDLGKELVEFIKKVTLSTISKFEIENFGKNSKGSLDCIRAYENTGARSIRESALLHVLVGVGIRRYSHFDTANFAQESSYFSFNAKSSECSNDEPTSVGNSSSFPCIRVKLFHQSGCLVCLSFPLFGPVKIVKTGYFRDINGEIRTNLTKLWEPSLVIQVEEDDNSNLREFLYESMREQYEIEGSSCNKKRLMRHVKPKKTPILYAKQIARFECHFVEFALKSEVHWNIGWKKGTQQERFVDRGSNTTEERRHFKKHIGANIASDSIFTAVKSSHLEFKVEHDMANVSCKTPYWTGPDFAASVQAFTVQDGKVPELGNPWVEHKETGENLELKCVELVSIPPSEYSWEYNGKKISANVTTLHHDEDTERYYSVLTIPRVSEADNGVYTCVCRNVLGEARKVFKVDVENDGRRLLIILGSTAITIILLILPAIIVLYKFHYEKKAHLSKQEIDEIRNGVDQSAEEDCYAHDMVKYMAFDRRYEVQFTNFQLSNYELGKGVHGVVYKGTMYGMPIAAKTLRPGVDKAVVKAMLEEAKIMIHLGKHENIVELKGACTEFLSKGRVYLLVEFCKYGSLHDFLVENRNKFCGNFSNADYVNNSLANRYEDAFNREDLLRWSVQIAQGMEYLESKKVIHGDLAARNVLMKSKCQVKITDFGLSRQLLNTVDYVKKSQELLPWRHMAIEALRSFKFSTQSDIWSYGVTVWEIFSLGAIPYPGVNWTPDFLEYLEDDMRLSKPKYATHEIYNTLLQCWYPEPEDRPSFQSLLNTFSEMLTS